MTSLIQWFTGDSAPAEAETAEAEADILAETRDALPAHVQEFLDLKASTGV